MTHPKPSQARSRAMIILIALVSFTPFGLAWLVAQHPDWIGKHSNYGHLILPPRVLNYDELFAHPISSPASLAELKGRWVMVHVATGPCSQTCADALHKTHQVRLMTNKEIARLKRLLLVPQTANPNDYAAQLQDDNLVVAAVPDSLVQTLTQAVGQAPGEGAILLLDPFANLMLWYENGFDPYGLLKDLKHLLKASQIG